MLVVAGGILGSGGGALADVSDQNKKDRKLVMEPVRKKADSMMREGDSLSLFSSHLVVFRSSSKPISSMCLLLFPLLLRLF